MAVATSAMFAPDAVRLEAIEVHVVRRDPSTCPPTPGTSACPPSFPSEPDFAGHAGHFGGKTVELVHHRVDGVLQLENLPLHVDGNLSRRSPRATAVVTSGNVSHLARQVGRHASSRSRSSPSTSPPPRAPRLTAELPLGPDFTRHAGHFRREPVELVHHRVDGLLELQNLPLHVDR